MLREEAWQLYIYILVFCWSQIKTVRSQEDCTDKDPCKCTLKNGSVVDLSSLGKTDSTPRFKDVLSVDGNYYSYNPCYGFNEGSECTDSAVCRTDPSQKIHAGLVKPVDGTINYDSENNKFIVQYLNPSAGAVVVNLVCDAGSSDPLFRADGMVMEGLYTLTLTSRCACLDGCKGRVPVPGPRPGSFSAGTLLCLIFVSLVVVYVIGGIAFMRYRDAHGLDMIPNVDFWKILPGLIKDGVVFTCGRCFRRSRYTNI
ncbi:hypothetical protein CHS0354_040204 [Potamilus streckersoni]|uniref:Autophagy-related protein 27 n=1 Tax=Potamilus streckersoni TaxID=2493646 RepID=A0AAE0SG98_9BIVA|nr:hypothetical protein CHS0354_040204 [Potamilus streckersoni]